MCPLERLHGGRQCYDIYVKNTMKTQVAKKDGSICTCRPICRNRRRMWKDKELLTSDENLQNEKRAGCSCRFPKQIELCRTAKRNAANEPGSTPAKVVKICGVPLDDTAETPYLHLAERVKKMGAWKAVIAACGSKCACASCLPTRERVPNSSECGIRDLGRERRMFDRRVAAHPGNMKIMYL